jgi:prepilin-type N-terminal cleavage/methylation domain-containing protein
MRKPIPRPAGLRDSGFTLIELMITMIVSALVARAIFVFFAGQQRVYDIQTKLLNVQENLWTAMELMSRHIRSSGAGMAAGCTKIRTYYDGQGVSQVAPAMIKNGANGAPDEMTITYFANSTSSWVDSMLSNTIPQDWTASAMKVDNAASFNIGDFILVLDTQQNPPNGDRGCTVFAVTQVPGSDKLLIVNPSSPWNAPGQAPGLIPFDYTGGAGGTFGVRNLGRMISVRFFIDSTGAPAVAPRLMMDDLSDTLPAAPLAEGIEDMQLAYGCDVSPTDGSLTEGNTAATRLTDEWIYNQAGDVPPASCTKPKAVRVTLMARTVTTETTLTLTGTAGGGGTSASGSAKAAAEDGIAGVPDLYRHRLLTTTVTPRN